MYEIEVLGLGVFIGIFASIIAAAILLAVYYEPDTHIPGLRQDPEGHIRALSDLTNYE